MRFVRQNRAHVAVTSALFAFCLIQFAEVTVARASELTTVEILDRMAKVYSQCESYYDSGTVEIVFAKSGGQTIVKESFTTVFVRSSGFRFEFNSDHRYILCRDESGVRSWSNVTSVVEEEKSLRSAVAAATGITSSSLHAIPALLVPDEIAGAPLSDSENAIRVMDASFCNADCFRVEQDLASGSRMVWIDKESYLVRRIDLVRSAGGFRVARTTVYDPVVNEAVTKEMLDFAPPNN